MLYSYLSYESGLLNNVYWTLKPQYINRRRLQSYFDKSLLIYRVLTDRALRGNNLTYIADKLDFKMKVIMAKI